MWSGWRNKAIENNAGLCKQRNLHYKVLGSLFSSFCIFNVITAILRSVRHVAVLREKTGENPLDMFMFNTYSV